MKKGKKWIVTAAVAGTLCMAGCYPDYSSYYKQLNQVPKTTAVKESLEEFDLASLQREDGAFQFGKLAWGVSKEEVEQVLGVSLKDLVTVADGSYADVNYSILLQDKISISAMPTFDTEEKFTGISFCFEDSYTAEALDALYADVVTELTALFGESDRVKTEETESGKMTVVGETTFWYHEVSDTQMTSLQVAKADFGTGTSAVVLGVVSYDPNEIEEETSVSHVDVPTKQEESTEE